MIFETSELRSCIKTYEAIGLDYVYCLKRLYLEGFKWDADCDETYYGMLSFAESKNCEYGRETINFLEEHADSWRNGCNYTEVKPANID